MLDSVIEKNIEFLRKYGVRVETEDDKGIYRYGLQILYSNIVNVSVILVISALCNRLYETAIMIFVFGVFQVFNGGYHAKTKIKCSALTVAGSIAGNALANFIQNHEIFMIVSAIVLSAVVIAVGSVTNIRHPVSKKTYSRSKRISRIAALASLVSAVLLAISGKNIEAAAIVSTLYLYVMSLSTAKAMEFQKKGGKMENTKTANDSEQKLARSLEQLNAEADWDIFLWLLRNTRKMAWIPPWDDIMMFKTTLIQEWNCLSEAETENMINDRVVLQKFLKMSSWEKAPNENNIRLFKAQIGEEGMRALFDLFDDHLENLGIPKVNVIDTVFGEPPRQRSSRKANANIKIG